MKDFAIKQDDLGHNLQDKLKKTYMASEKSSIYKMTGEKDNFGRRTKDLQERNTVIWDFGEMSLWLSKQEIKDYIY